MHREVSCTKQLLDAAKTGPRGVGKTTSASRLVRSTAELPRDLERMRIDAEALLAGLPTPVLIDEWKIAGTDLLWDAQAVGRCRPDSRTLHPDRQFRTSDVRAHLPAHRSSGATRHAADDDERARWSRRPAQLHRRPRSGRTSVTDSGRTRPVRDGLAHPSRVSGGAQHGGGSAVPRGLRRVGLATRRR